jgi:RNA polymerase sigma-70 factor (ECF subfamily)
MEEELRRQAVERAYRDHADDVYRVAFAIVREPEAAMDVTQDAFARAFERWDQYDAHRPLRPWLHGIAAHAALDALRRRRVRDLLRGGNVTEITVSDRDPFSDPAIAVGRRELMEEALARLQPLPRAALVLRHYYGYDYAEIGTFLGLGSGTVGSVLSRAHAVLRQRLGDQADEAQPSLSTPNHESAATPPEVLP